MMRYFVDMDGTLAVYPEEKEWWLIPGIFPLLEPQLNVIKAVKKLIEEGRDVYVLSAYPEDSPEVKEDKNRWLDKYLPELKSENRLFTLNGHDKTEAVTDGVTGEDILLDDYNKNLRDWKEAGGTGIKLLNGINSKSSWSGLSACAHGSIKDILFVLSFLREPVAV